MIDETLCIKTKRIKTPKTKNFGKIFQDHFLTALKEPFM
jgi:hypothetical protein